MRRRSVLAAVAGLAVTAAMVINPAAAAAPPGVNPQQSLSASDPESLAATAADRAVASGLDELRKGPDETYWRRAVTAGASGMYYVNYERTYKGLPVVGGDAVVVTDSQGRVRDTAAASGPAEASVATTPQVSAERAVRVSKGRLSRVDKADTPRLVVLAWGARPKLAWETIVEGVAAGKPSKQHVFVDARTGKVADHYDEVKAGTGNGYYYPNVTIDTSQQSGTYRMVDTSRPGYQCGGQNGSPYTGPDDVWGNNSGTDLETACVDTLYGAQREWDMLRDWLGRNGVDGQGRGFPARVGLNQVNAFWNGSYTSFGRSQDGQRQVTPIDVVAHEYGHAIFQTTPGGAGSGNENGGINEGTGDIFGALTEHFANNPNDPPDYEVGEEVNLVGDGPIRYMYEPSRVGDPNCWSTSIPNTEVHAAAGPINHWFYLLAEGNAPGGGKPNSPICSGGPSSVSGIGIQKAGKIFMGALNRKTSSWRYANVRSASLAAAVELYGANSTECAVTKAAWNAVSVPVQSGEPTCTASSQDFSIATNPGSGSVEPGQSATTTVGTQTTQGAAQTVNLTASGLPSGATATFNPTSVTSGNSSTLTIATSSTTPRGTFTVTVTGTGQTATHTATYGLTVGGGTPTDPPDISLTNVKAHLSQFQTIATNNGGNRRSTGAGYTASVTYLEQKLQAAGYAVRRVACGSTCTSGAGPNLVADWPGGDENQVIMAGAHLDSVSAGPGINDNASGSSALLEVALTLAAQRPNMLKHVRFGWWSDEEQGLNGSEGYVASLSQADRSKIQVYHNYDMVGSPNGGYFINNINTTAAQHLKAFYDARNLQPEENTEGANRSDDASFRNAGIATSGVAAGASYTKTAAQAAKWGGTAGQAYDRCYHQSCDNSTNINDTVIDRASDAAAYAIWKLAVGTGNPPTRDFSIAANPSSGTVQAGSPATTTINTQTTAGTAQTVNLTASGLPAGASASFNPASVTSGGNSTLTISTSTSTPAGAHTVTISGAGETATRTTVFTLTVQSTQPGRTFRNDTDYQIRDFTYIQSPVTSNASGTAQSPVKVTATSNHTCLEDLDIWLRGPNGTWYQIRAAGGTSCSAFGTRTWSVPVTQQAAGQWVLYIEDVYAQDQGVLDSWSVTV